MKYSETTDRVGEFKALSISMTQKIIKKLIKKSDNPKGVSSAEFEAVISGIALVYYTKIVDSLDEEDREDASISMFRALVAASVTSIKPDDMHEAIDDVAAEFAEFKGDVI